MRNSDTQYNANIDEEESEKLQSKVALFNKNCVQKKR